MKIRHDVSACTYAWPVLRHETEVLGCENHALGLVTLVLINNTAS